MSGSTPYPGSKDGGVLTFVNPAVMSAMYIDAGNTKTRLPHGHQNANLMLEAGQLAMFPSWVLHDVKPLEGEGERIMITFICWLTLPDA